jgi:hypothetical protein
MARPASEIPTATIRFRRGERGHDQAKARRYGIDLAAESPKFFSTDECTAKEHAGISA